MGRDVRDPLRTAVRLELSGSAEDLDSGLTSNDTEATFDARERVEDAALLLDDLGWSDGDARETFHITMPVSRLIALLARVEQATAQALMGHARRLRSAPSAKETAHERRDRLDAISEFADQDLDTRNAVVKLRAALDQIAG